jgi:hypothetical protein
VIRLRRSSASRVLAKENAFTPSPASALALRGLAEREGSGSSVIGDSVLGNGMALRNLGPCVDDGDAETEVCKDDNSLVV